MKNLKVSAPESTEVVSTLAALVTLPGDTTLASTGSVVAELVAYAVKHPFVKDKSPRAIASRAAQKLNQRKSAPPAGEPYWTGPVVLAAFPEAFASIAS